MGTLEAGRRAGSIGADFCGLGGREGGGAERASSSAFSFRKL